MSLLPRTSTPGQQVRFHASTRVPTARKESNIHAKHLRMSRWRSAVPERSSGIAPSGLSPAEGTYLRQFTSSARRARAGPGISGRCRPDGPKIIFRRPYAERVGSVLRKALV